MHQRMMPMQYRFDYRVFGLLIDIDQIEQEVASLKWISMNRFNLLGLNSHDHGARDGTEWRSWVESTLNGICSEKIGTIRLMCFPKILGYNFNPLSVWYCENSQGHTIAIISEVRNTFGSQYHYIHHNHGAALSWPVECEADKRFHVSPFINMHQQYHFRFTQPSDHFSVLINEYQDDQLHLIASQTAKTEDLTNKGLLRAFFMMPMMSLKIITMIHWHALKIWLRGGKFHSYTQSHQPETKSEWIVKTPKQ